GTNSGTLDNPSGCFAFTNSYITGVTTAVNLGIPRTLYDHNTTNYFAQDGLDFWADNVTISHNLITNAIDNGSGVHPDGIQGQIGRVSSTSVGYFGDVIDSNMVIRQSDPNLAVNNFMQGISAFDMNWYNLTVTNNIVLTDTFHAYSWSSVH